MAKQSHQQRIISNYYEHHDEIMLQRLGELLADLYLAQGKARVRLWQRAAAALKNLKVPEQQIDHLIASDNPSLLAAELERMLAKK